MITGSGRTMTSMVLFGFPAKEGRGAGREGWMDGGRDGGMLYG